MCWPGAFELTDFAYIPEACWMKSLIIWSFLWNISRLTPRHKVLYLRLDPLQKIVHCTLQRLLFAVVIACGLHEIISKTSLKNLYLTAAKHRSHLWDADVIRQQLIYFSIFVFVLHSAQSQFVSRCSCTQVLQNGWMGPLSRQETTLSLASIATQSSF